jgi:UDPglucose 6-dehydrogenase
VIGVDVDENKVAMINAGKSPIYEPGLEDLLKKAIRNGSLRCVTEFDEAVLGSDITFISVGTPALRNGNVDLRQVKAAARDIGRALKEKRGYHLVVVSSTVLPGTTESLVQPIIEKYSEKAFGRDFGLCMNPEFLREGNAIHDFFHPHLIVIGECDKRSGDKLKDLCRTFLEDRFPSMRVNPPTAELIKYANNAFLATKISLMNTIANICERIPHVDIVKVADAIGTDPRIGLRFLRAGIGFGGSCLPKDLRGLVTFAEAHGYRASLLKAVSEANRNQCQRVFELAKIVLGRLERRRIAILGLAFKPGTDDMREAPSRSLIELFLKARSTIIAYDPIAMKNAKEILPKISYAESALKCLENADCSIVVTEWDEFKSITPEDFLSRMRRPVLIDGRRIYDPERYATKMHFYAIGLGRHHIGANR